MTCGFDEGIQCHFISELAKCCLRTDYLPYLTLRSIRTNSTDMEEIEGSRWNLGEPPVSDDAVGKYRMTWTFHFEVIHSLRAGAGDNSVAQGSCEPQSALAAEA